MTFFAVNRSLVESFDVNNSYQPSIFELDNSTSSESSQIVTHHIYLHSPPLPEYSLEYLKTIEVFESAEDGEVEVVQKMTGNPLISQVSQWIKNGEWTLSIHKLLSMEKGHLFILAAYAMGCIDSDETITAFIFLNGAVESEDGQWEIKKSVEFANDDSIPDHLKYAIFYSTSPENMFAEPEKILSDGKGVGSFPIISKKFSHEGGLLKPIPIYRISLREGLINRWKRNFSDISLIPPGTQVEVHGHKYNLLKNIQHDLVHWGQRNILGETNDITIHYVEILENCQKKLPAIVAKIKEGGNSYIYKNSSFNDQVHYLLFSLSGAIIDSLNFNIKRIIKETYPTIDLKSFRSLLEEMIDMLDCGLDYSDRALYYEGYLHPNSFHQGIIDGCLNLLENSCTIARLN
jgi:hypothetical protein